MGLQAGADGGARAVAAVLGGYVLPITCAIVNRLHPGLQPSVPREALNTGRGLFGEVLQHIINSIIFNNHWKAERNRSAMNFLPPCSPCPRSPRGWLEGSYIPGVAAGQAALAGYLVHRVPSPGSVASIARPGTGALFLGTVGKGHVPKEGPLTPVPCGWSPGNDALSLGRSLMLSTR